MRRFVLLLVCLAAGRTARSKGKGCKEGGVKLTCKNENCQISGVSPQKHARLQKVILGYSEVEEQQQEVEHERRLEFEVDEDCAKPLHYTAYKTGTTTIACNVSELIKSSSTVKLFCKQGQDECITSREFNPTHIWHGFNITISQLTERDSGVYWCGLTEKQPRRRTYYHAALQRIQLSVLNIRTFKRSRTVGQDFSFYCSYDDLADLDSHPKFVCMGDDPQTCRTVARTSTPDNGRFSLDDESGRRNMTVLVRELMEEDSGTYWCGAEDSNGDRGNVFINKLSLIVVPAQSSTSASPLSMTTAASVGKHNGSEVLITASVCVVLLLLLVTVLILIYKRFSASKNSEPPNTKENYIYEEIGERPLTPHSGTAVNTVYAMATLPSLHYATIDIVRRSDGTAGDSQIHKQDSCLYSTVMRKQSAASSSSSSSSSSP